MPMNPGTMINRWILKILPMPKIQPKGKTIEFKETQNTLKNLRKEWEKMKLANELGVRKETQQKTEDEQFNYPFGGWANEVNRK